MSSKNIIAVVGATGTQGSSVAKTFVSLPGWHVRCLSRQPTSQKAQELAALGAEVVQANLEDLESLSHAFQGARAIFVNTDFWGTYQSSMAAGRGRVTSSQLAYDTELQNAKNASVAAAGVQSLEKFIFSALGPMKAASGGKYPHSHHWESKAAAVNFIEQELPDLAKKTSFIYVGAYNTNTFLLPQRNPQTGKYEMVLPGPKETRFPIIDPARSTGSFVRALVESEAPGTKLLAYDSDLTIAEAVEAWSEVTGKEADFVQMTLQEMHEVTGLPFEVLDGAAYLGEFSYTAGIEGVIRPAQLRDKVETSTYHDFLRTRDMDYLLGSQHSKV